MFKTNILHQQRKQSARKQLYDKKVSEMQQVKDEKELITQVKQQSKSTTISLNSLKVQQVNQKKQIAAQLAIVQSKLLTAK